MEFQDYHKYKWFFTSSGKLVVGGKSAEQNDKLLKKVKSQSFSHDLYVMHTSFPGSPFSIILANKDSVSKSDLEECAIFTACFSQQWKSGKKFAYIDIFYLSQVSKSPLLKTGTWAVKKKIKKLKVKLELVLTTQEGKLRAVPETASREFFFKVAPGKIDKEKILPKLEKLILQRFSKEEFLSALPSGGISIVR